MGTIVMFAARREAQPRPAPDRACEITIFPGVRYERRTDPPPPNSAAATARRPEDLMG